MARKANTQQIVTEVLAKYKWKWANADGVIGVSTKKPKPHEEFNEWWGGGDVQYIGKVNPDVNWRETLRKIEPVEYVED